MELWPDPARVYMRIRADDLSPGAHTMISLHDSIYSSPHASAHENGTTPPDHATVRPPPRDDATASTKFAEETRACARYRGLTPPEVTAVVCVGLSQSRQLEQLSEAFPGLRTAVLCEPDASFLACTPRDPPTLSGALTPRDCWILTDTSLPTADTPRRVYAEVSQLFVQRDQALRCCVLVVWPPDRAHERSPVVDGLEDLLYGFGSLFVAAVERAGSLQREANRRQLQSWANALYEQREYLHALQCFLLLFRARSSPTLARVIASTWQELECPQQALRWLDEAALDPEEHEIVQRELTDALAHQHEEATKLAQANIEHIASEYPGLGGALAAAVPADLCVAWLRDRPWILGGELPDERVKYADYPLLLRVQDHNIEALNFPRQPRVLHTAVGRLNNLVFAHTCIGHATSVDLLLNVLRNPVEWGAPNWRQAVYVVQEDLGMLRRFVEICDFRKLLVTARVDLHWGKGAEKRLLSVFAEDRSRCLPGVKLGLTPTLAAGFEGVAQDRLRASLAAIDRIMSYHTLARADATLEKLRRGEPLKIWALCSIRTSVLQYLMTDLLDAFRDLGHECELLLERDARDYVGNLIAVSVAETRPDFLIMADHLRAQVPRVLPPSLPCLTLILDELPSLSAPETIAELGPYDLAFPWSHALCRGYTKLGYKHTTCLPFAANPERYNSEGNELPLENVVAFATHLDVPVDFDFSPGFSEFLVERYTSMPQVPRGREAVRRVVDEAVAEFGLSVPKIHDREFYYQALLLTRVADRTQIADEILRAGIPLALYGRGWGERARYRSHARGILTPGEDLRAMYHTHKVILHVNQNCNMHPRVLEAMCAKGFVLARSDGGYCSETSDDWVGQYFDLDTELCLFSSLEDMLAKIRRALTDEAWRQSFIHAGHARVLRDHTYKTRAQTMLVELSRRLSARTRTPWAA